MGDTTVESRAAARGVISPIASNAYLINIEQTSQILPVGEAENGPIPNLNLNDLSNYTLEKHYLAPGCLGYTTRTNCCSLIPPNDSPASGPVLFAYGDPPAVGQHQQACTEAVQQEQEPPNEYDSPLLASLPFNHSPRRKIKKSYQCAVVLRKTGNTPVPNCNFQTSRLRDIGEHIWSIHRIRAFKCPNCGIRVARRDNLTGHQRYCGGAPTRINGPNSSDTPDRRRGSAPDPPPDPQGPSLPNSYYGPEKTVLTFLPPLSLSDVGLARDENLAEGQAVLPIPTLHGYTPRQYEAMIKFQEARSS
ncbi:hypothetical protein TWF730_010028 [Orbilia blumenaviensis]|uniref:C2H2-type domain-containing protein n=1 Tax=Orbilia blumenaviensis TaxID=1796055 RepID=A0AAV9UWZ6_9PEZI